MKIINPMDLRYPWLSGFHYYIATISFCLIQLLFSLTSEATTYTTTGSGTWDANGAPPSPLLNGDIVNVNHNGVFFDWPNTATIQSGATFNINNGGHIQLMHLVINSGGIMNLNTGGTLQSVGSITNHSDNVIIDGSLSDNDTFTNNGAITGSGTINVGNPPATGSGTINGTAMDDIDWSEEVDMSEPLPVTLLSFRAKTNGNLVMIEWSTASETNNAYFTVERSTNGIDWNTLDRITGAGNTTTLRTYRYNDKVGTERNWYYRLKQTDFDGTHEYFSPVMVEIKFRTHMSTVSAMQQDNSLRFFGPSHSKWRLYDLRGQLLYQGIIESSGEANLNSKPNESGLYLLTVGSQSVMILVK